MPDPSAYGGFDFTVAGLVGTITTALAVGVALTVVLVLAGVVWRR